MTAISERQRAHFLYILKNEKNDEMFLYTKIGTLIKKRDNDFS